MEYDFFNILKYASKSVDFYNQLIRTQLSLHTWLLLVIGTAIASLWAVRLATSIYYLTCWGFFIDSLS